MARARDRSARTILPGRRGVGGGEGIGEDAPHMVDMDEMVDSGSTAMAPEWEKAALVFLNSSIQILLTSARKTLDAPLQSVTSFPFWLVLVLLHA